MWRAIVEVAVQRVRDHGRNIITEELRRLRRKADLSPRDLDAVGALLDGLLDQILVARLELLAARRPDLLPAAVELVDPSGE